MKRNIKLLSLLLAIICAFSALFVSCEREEDEETEAEEIVKTEEEIDQTDAPTVTDEETTGAPETTAAPETTVEETTAPETTEHVHSYVSTENTASCTGDVTVYHTCACGDKKTEILPMIAHNFVNNVCSMCGLENVVYSKGLEYKLNDDKASYSLIGIGTCTDADIIIPSKYENLPVTNIESDTFKGNKTIKSIVIPESIKTIGMSVLNDADSLVSITFKNGVTDIDYGAFYSCDALAEIVLPESLRTVGSNVFASCKNLKSITLNDGLTEIGSGSFEAYSPFGNYNDAAFTFYGNGKYLGTKDNPYYAFFEITNPFNTTSCEIHKDTKVIAAEAFSNSIIEELTIPSGVDAINYMAFTGATALKTLKFEGTVKYIDPQAIGENKKIIYNEYEGASYLGNDANPYLILVSVNDKTKASYVIHPDAKQIAGNAFRKCTALKSFVIPEHITVLGSYSFADCTALTSIVIPASITEIPEGFLNGCIALTEFTVPDNITSIGGYALRGCSALEKIVMKNNVKNIGAYVFAFCSKLNDINFYGTEDEWNNIQKGKNWDWLTSFMMKVTIIEPTVLDNGASEGITYIKSKDGKYYYVSSIGICTDTDIVISSTCNGLPVELINKNAFEGCKNITSVTIPSSVKNIDSAAFKNCTSLKKVTLAEGVGKITFLAFEGCTALEEVNIPSTCFVANGFVGCSSLKTLNISPANQNFKMVGNCLIYNDKANNIENALVLILGEQKIPSDAGIKIIMSNAFYYSEITEIVIPEGVTSIEISAFDKCSNLEKITLPESLVSIGNAAFKDCKSLREVFIPKNVNALGINPFNGCTALTSITVDPENKAYKVVDNCIVDIANKKLVVGCESSKIPNDGSVTTIGQASFSGIENIKNIEINDHITKIEIGAFMNCHGIEKLVIPDSVTEIKSAAIYNMASLMELVIGNGVTSFEGIDLLQMNNLQKLTIGSGITVIEKYDLMSCKASEIILTKSIKKIEESAICYCSNLTAIRYEGTMAEWNAIEKESGWDNGTNSYTVYCSDGEIKK